MNRIDKRILDICNCEYNYFLNKVNVVGIGLGYKVMNGFCTFKKCILVFVENKVSIQSLYFKNTIPKFYRGILTDVIEINKITLQSLLKKVRPVTGGYSISPITNSPGGTMGCLVTDGTTSYILSNNHVLASEGEVPLDEGITQPNIHDGGHVPEDIIANLSKYVPLKYSTSSRRAVNYVDCAIGKVINSSVVSNKITFLGSIHGTATAILKEKVQKVGATTELTSGEVVSIGTTITMPYSRGECLFKDQIITTSMSKLGDSGAILLDRNMNAIGLLAGGSSSKSIFNPIDSVLKSFNLTIVS